MGDSPQTRIRLGIEMLGLTQTRVAKSLGISKQSIGQMLNGRNPGRAHWPKLAQILQTTEQWIATGTGSAPSWAAVATSATVVMDPAEMINAISRLTAEVTALRAEIRARDARLTVLSGAMEKVVAIEGGPSTNDAREKADAALLDSITHER